MTHSKLRKAVNLRKANIDRLNSELISIWDPELKNTANDNKNRPLIEWSDIRIAAAANDMKIVVIERRSF